MTVRLNKYLRDSGLCSRRKADEFIAKGFVSVDGEVVTDLGTKIDPLVNKVEISSDAEKETDSYRYILLYKPVDYITTKNEYEGKTVFDLVPNIENLTYSGRLDKDSEGLIILSNDGNFIYHVANPDNEKEIGANIPGTILKVLVKEGEKVEANQPIAVIEAMKMETNILAPVSGEVDKIYVNDAQQVKSGELIATLK